MPYLVACAFTVMYLVMLLVWYCEVTSFLIWLRPESALTMLFLVNLSYRSSFKYTFDLSVVHDFYQCCSFE